MLDASPPQRILVVDDDVDIAQMIVQQLHRAGYETEAAVSVRAAREVIARHPFDLLVLDLTLPDGDGLDFCRDLKRADPSRTVMMVTARDAPVDRVLGLELGADDYLTKPFEPRELLARVRNLLRRRAETPTARANKTRARFGPWTLDMVHRRLIAADGRLVILSSAEYRLLERFVSNPHAVLSREALLPDGRYLAHDRTIDVQISRLRTKLSAPGEPLILTVRNEGYVLAANVVFE